MRNYKKKSLKIEKFDYEKMANEIIRSQTEKNKEYSFANEWMKYLTTAFLIIIAILSIVIAISLFITINKEFISSQLTNINFHFMIIIALKVIVALFLLSVSLYSIFVIKELDKEKDKAYIINMFSSVNSFFAVIIALFALFNEVL